MAVFKRGKVYWYTFVFNGEEIRETTKSRNKQIARDAERQRRKELEEGYNGLKKKAKAKLFADAAEDFIESQAHWAEKTCTVHRGSFKNHLKEFFGNMILNQINPEAIRKYQVKRKKEGASGRTVNIEISLVRLVLKNFKMWSWIADDVKKQRENKDVGREITEAEQDRLLDAAKRNASRSLYPAILVSIHTGLRNEELRLLRWKQVNFIDGEITVGKSKTEGGEGRKVPLSQTALQTLKDWRSRFPEALPGHAVWPRESYGLIGKKGTFGGVVKPYQTFPDEPIGSWKSAWETTKKTAKVECRWHDLRHSAVSRVAATGEASEQTLQKIFGWMSPKMIERYSHVRAEAKRKAIAAAFDRPTAIQ